MGKEGDHSFVDKKTELFKAILALKTVQEAKNFFEDLCTPAELQDLSDRWAVVEPLKNGLPYRQIHEITGISVTTIGRVARCLKYGSDGYNLIFSRLLKSRTRKK